MKIALVSLARRGGMVHFQAELANSLVRITPTVAITSSAASPTYFSPELPRLTVDTGQGRLTSLTIAMNPMSWYGMLRQLRASAADLVHVVGAHEWNPIVAVMSKALGKPLVYTMHDPEPHRGTSLAMRISNRFTARAADAIVVLTRRGKRQLVSQGYPEQNIYHIPLGAFSFLTQWRRKQLRAEKMLLFFGRLESYKGLDVLLEAFAQVRHLLPNWKLVIAGSGDLPAWRTLDDHSRIEFVNRFLTDEEVAGLMQRARLVVLPYTEATQSGVIVVAYAFGRPVIATNVGGLNEMVIDGKTGVLVPPDNAAALARAIHRLASDAPRLAEMGRNALALSRLRWSWARIARLHMAMYSKILARHRTA
jgi:glycosyltransferase involved in cell wall biosynthesis